MAKATVPTLALAICLSAGAAAAQSAPEQATPLPSALAPATEGAPAASGNSAPSAWYDSLYATDLIGKDVHNTAGDEIAEVENIVFDANAGQLLAVVSTGGFLGIGSKDVSVSLAALEKNGDNDLMLPKMTEAELKAMPEYDQGTHQPVQSYQRLGAIKK